MAGILRSETAKPQKIAHTWTKWIGSPVRPTAAANVTMLSLPNTRLVLAFDTAGTYADDGRVETTCFLADFLSIGANNWARDHTQWIACTTNRNVTSVRPPPPRSGAIAISLKRVGDRYFFFFGGGTGTNGAALLDAYIGVLEPMSPTTWMVTWLPVLADTLQSGTNPDPYLSTASFASVTPSVISAADIDPTGKLTNDFAQRFVPFENMLASQVVPLVVRNNDDIFLIKPLGFTDATRRHSCYVVRLRQGSSSSEGEKDFYYGCDGIVPVGGASGWPITERHGLTVCPLAGGFFLGIETPIDAQTIDTAFSTEPANTWIAEVRIAPKWSPVGTRNSTSFTLQWKMFGRCSSQSPLLRIGSFVMSSGYRLNRADPGAFVAVWGGAAIPANTADKEPLVYVGSFALADKAGTSQYAKTPTFTWHSPSRPTFDSSGDGTPDGNFSKIGIVFAGGCETRGENSLADDPNGPQRFRFMTYGGLGGANGTVNQTRTAIITFAVPKVLLAAGVGIAPGKPCFIDTPDSLLLKRDREIQYARTGTIADTPVATSGVAARATTASTASTPTPAPASDLAVNGEGATASETPWVPIAFSVAGLAVFGLIGALIYARTTVRNAKDRARADILGAIALTYPDGV